MGPKRAIHVIFPWGSDSESEDATETMPPRAVTGPIMKSSLIAVPDGITYRCIPQNTQAGKVLQHCKDCVEKLRRDTGGESLAIFKIGITHDCTPRFQLYESNGYTKMLVMHSSNDLATIEMLESALIAIYRDKVQCRNVQLGGEGMRNRYFEAKFDPPYHCYCVAARADLPRWVRD